MVLYLTAIGKGLIQQCLVSPEDAYIKFNGVSIGNGNNSGLDDQVTALANELNTMSITGMTFDDTFVNIAAYLNNASVSASYRATEMGVWVENPDNPSQKILFAYGYIESSNAMYIPSAGDYTLETTLIMKVYIGDVEDVSAVISESLVYATKSEFEGHIYDYDNPHMVTKTQVGLANVPNVSTNNQTPTYTVPGSASNLSSGETLSTAFGKIARAISNLISHIADRANPHAVTYLQTGAAAQYHYHNAADINSGIMSVANGGTGVSSIAALANSLKSHLASLSHTHSAAEITSGIMPVEQGGTGVGSLSDFAANIYTNLLTYLAAKQHEHDITDIPLLSLLFGNPDAFGTYTGQGTSGVNNYHFIEVGFKPSKVVIFVIPEYNTFTRSSYQSNQSYYNYFPLGSYYYCFGTNNNIYHSGCGDMSTATPEALFARGHGGAAVMTNGFGVAYYSGTADVDANGRKYLYLAWK